MRARDCLFLLFSLLAPSLVAQMPGVRLYPIPDAFGFHEVTQGPDGRMWTGQSGPGYICALNAANGHSVCTAAPLMGGMASGPDGNVWFGTNTGVGRITPSMQVTLFQTGGAVTDIVAGRDGHLWYAGHVRNVIGRITPSGQWTEFPGPTPLAFPYRITAIGDSLWGISLSPSILVRIELDGTMTTFTLPFAGGNWDMTTGHDGNLWIANSDGIKVVNGAGAVVSSYAVHSYSITRGPRGSMWFGYISAFGRIVDGVVTEFQIRPLIGQFEHRGITSSADGAIWMTQYNSGPIPPPPTASAQTEASAGLVRIDPDGVVPIPTISFWTLAALVTALATWAVFALR